MPRSRPSRRALVWVLVVVGSLIVTGGTLGFVWLTNVGCPYPYDARAYAQPRCSGGLFSTSTTFTTLDQSLSTFGIPLPEDARGVRFYIDPGSFHGGYAFFLHFTAPPPEVNALLAKIGSTRATTTAETAWGGWGSEPVPWKFDDSSRYAVYDFTARDDEDIDQGVVIVDHASTEPAVYLFIYAF
jgi:hypothetical protein